MIRANIESLLITSKSKEVYWRKTQKNNYLLYSPGSELLVFDANTWYKSIMPLLRECQKGDELFQLLKENSFFEQRGQLPLDNAKWLQQLRILSSVVGILAIVLIITKIGNINVLSYDFKEKHFIIFFLFGIFFSILTTGLHEMMHICFSNNFHNIGRILDSSFNKSVATVDLTHVWLWPIFSRSMAVLAGLILDSVILSYLFLMSDNVTNPFLALSIYVMIFRILWQFRPDHHTDSRLLVFMLLDNPFLKVDFENNRTLLTEREKFLWRICKILSLIVTAIMFIVLIFLVSKIVGVL